MGDLSQEPQLVSPAAAAAPPPPPTPFFGVPRHSHAASFPITAVAIIGIIATGFLLLSYYIFVIKCCLNWHRIDLLRRFSVSRRRRVVDDPFSVYSPAGEIRRGLDESTIRSIPVLQYKKGSDSRECCVCLNEFQEGEKVRVIPNCGHPFHIDCIDVWLQNNPNCPLCRNPISAPKDPFFSDRDEDYVVIEIGQDNGIFGTCNIIPGELSPTLSISPSPIPKFPEKALKLHSQSLGDECIDICREKDERFAVEPIRRSLSMSSAVDRRQLASQNTVQRQRLNRAEVSSSEGSSSRPKKLCFSFGHRRGSRSSVIPVHLEP
ncbi:PREDICTED: RING-H2 finger protein ATL16-like [Ipomoea nil]|uniref:RING-H2 finger protein ATL16-like n=1 Tax=Ipomoea nil TaxID=35883 RepID=UPI0009014FCF|nr:PREDICTED: RING-H2 finger protein ATL16-like [Ipomoea nil]